jgi:transcriptional regulator with XRE-family HTH domain
MFRFKEISMDITFGSLLKMHRESNGFSQKKLLETLKERDIYIYSKATISKWENGIHKPKAAIIEELEDILGLARGTLLRQAGYLLEGQLTANDNPIDLIQHVNLKRLEEHFTRLSKMIDTILDGGLDRISNSSLTGQHEILEAGYSVRTLSQDQLIAILEENLHNAYQQYSDSQVDCQLFAHIAVEYPKFKDIYGFINENPLEVVDILRTLAQMKTFKDTCPVCKDWIN